MLINYSIYLFQCCYAVKQKKISLHYYYQSFLLYKEQRAKFFTLYFSTGATIFLLNYCFIIIIFPSKIVKIVFFHLNESAYKTFTKEYQKKKTFEYKFYTLFFIAPITFICVSATPPCFIVCINKNFLSIHFLHKCFILFYKNQL